MINLHLYPSLAEAFGGLKRQVALVIMGYGEQVLRICKRSAELSNVFYHAAVPPDRLLSYTGAADYGVSVIEPVSLSYEYCMPNKLFEYPVLVSPTSEQRALVERYGVGVVSHDTTVEAVREAVVHLLSRDLGELLRAVERVKREFCWEQQERIMRQSYVDSLALRSAREQSA